MEHRRTETYNTNVEQAESGVSFALDATLAMSYWIVEVMKNARTETRYTKEEQAENEKEDGYSGGDDGDSDSNDGDDCDGIFFRNFPGDDGD